MYLLLSKRRKIRRILGVRLTARRAQLILVRSDAVPTETTNLVATGARIKVEVVNLKGLHAQWAFRKFIAAGIHHVHNCF